MNPSNTVAFDEAFEPVPVGMRKVKEREYLPVGQLPVVDQGKKLVSGFTNKASLAIAGDSFIMFGDHTRAIKYIDFPFVAGADGVKLFRARDGFDAKFLFFFLSSQRLPADGYGRHSKHLQDIRVPNLKFEAQGLVVARLEAALAEYQKAKNGAEAQVLELQRLADSFVFESLKAGHVKKCLGHTLDEVKRGIGSDWASHPVLGATRDGLAPAKEQPGKQAPKYKPATPGTVFYNPMRILIGSVAMVDDDDTPGITSPDYVVLRGKPGVVDSRWFYHWLRSPLGAQYIQSLARGSVRERMLFNRLAEGEAALPGFVDQQRASAALKELKPLKRALESRLSEINRLPQKILAAAFET